MFTESLTQFGRRSFAKLAAAGAVMALTGTGALAQDDAANFYEGKTVTIYVGFSPGGGYDLYGRLAALVHQHRHVHLPVQGLRQTENWDF